MTYPKPLIGKVLAAVLEDATRRENDAGFGGGFHDGGASRLRDMVNAYVCGMEGIFPVGWETYLDQAKKESDPDWVEYRRLKKKFEES